MFVSRKDCSTHCEWHCIDGIIPPKYTSSAKLVELLWLCTGIMDFVPQPTDSTYEGFEDLIDRMNGWLKELRGIQVIRIQSLMVQKHDGEKATNN